MLAPPVVPGLGPGMVLALAAIAPAIFPATAEDSLSNVVTSRLDRLPQTRAAALLAAVELADERIPKHDNPTPRECMEFLVAHMPERDLRSPNVSAAFLLRNVELALRARNYTSWGRAVPVQLFLNDVLPYAALSEPRGHPDWEWRPEFHAALMPLVADLPSASAAAEAGVNTQAWGALKTPAIKFVAAPTCQINSYSPVQTLHRGNSSCTGLALFAAMAMRAVGLPARVAGAPHWDVCRCGLRDCSCAHCPEGDRCDAPGDADGDCGNHNWAEVWADGSWHFVDPAGSKTLDDGWFAGKAAQQSVGADGFYNHSVMASSWAATSSLDPAFYPLANPAPRFPMVWDWADSSVPGWDVTPRYISGDAAGQNLVAVLF